MESKSQWYYENQGKAEGPISTLELVRKIREGELSLLDLIFKEGEGQWMPAEHFPEIKNLIKTTPTQFKADSDWIVLRTVEVDGRDQFEQIGPFTIEQVLQLIDKGRVKFTDFVWRNGYENWVPLGQVDQFENPLESSVQVDLSIYEKPRQEDLNAKGPITKNYKPAEKIKISQSSEAKPVEAKGEDLARPKWDISPAAVEPVKARDVRSEKTSLEKSKESPSSPRKENKLDAEPSEGAVENTERREQRAITRGRWQAVASILVLVIFFSGAGLFLVYGRKAYQSFQNRSNHIVFEPVSVSKKSQPPVAQSQPLQEAIARTPSPSAVPIAKIVPTAKIEKRAPAPEVVVKSPPIVNTAVVAKVTESKSVNSELEFSQMSAKQKSYFLNRERLFLFYQSQRGYKLVTEIQKIVQKPDKKKNLLKNKVDAWVKQAQGLATQVRVESKETHLYPDFFKRLLATSQQLDERGREIQSQLINGRGPSKELTLKEVEIEFKKIMMQARDLD